MTNILGEETTQNIQVEKIWLHTWGKSLRISFMSNLSFIWNYSFFFYVGILASGETI